MDNVKKTEGYIIKKLIDVCRNIRRILTQPRITVRKCICMNYGLPPNPKRNHKIPLRRTKLDDTIMYALRPGSSLSGARRFKYLRSLDI